MAVVTVSPTTIKPDQYEEFVAHIRKVKGIIEKNGAKNVRLLAGLVAGEATESFVFTSEADDFAAAGAIMDKSLADPEIVALMSTGPESPLVGYQISMWVDVPL